MNYEPTGEVNVSTSFKLPTYHRDRLYHILLGDYAALVDAINRMAVAGYCDRVSWMTPVPTLSTGQKLKKGAERGFDRS